MKIVNESLNEFQRGKSPEASLDIGNIKQIEKDLETANIPIEMVEIDNDFLIKPAKPLSSRQIMYLIPIQLKYMPEKWADFVKNFAEQKSYSYDINELVQDAIDDGIDIDKVEELVEMFGDAKDVKFANITITKNRRSQEEIEEDEDQNIYVFIGYQDKVPVEVNGKTYYEDKFAAESLIKIDKYKKEDLEMVPMMKIRARNQYPDGNVYMLQVPKYFMDKERYSGIPEEYFSVVDEYKRKI